MVRDEKARSLEYNYSHVVGRSQLSFSMLLKHDVNIDKLGEEGLVGGLSLESQNSHTHTLFLPSVKPCFA